MSFFYPFRRSQIIKFIKFTAYGYTDGKDSRTVMINSSTRGESGKRTEKISPRTYQNQFDCCIFFDISVFTCHWSYFKNLVDC